MTTTTLTVRRHQLTTGHAMTGPRHTVMRRYHECGLVLWLRANDRATLYYRGEHNEMRQKTWKTFRLAD